MEADRQALRVRPQTGVAVLAWAGGLGTLLTIAAPIASNPDTADTISVHLTGWNSPPLTALLVGLSFAFMSAGWRARAGEGLSSWQAFLILPLVAGAVAAIAIPYGSINNIADSWQSQWGAGLLVASVSVGALGYVLCAMTGRTDEPEAGRSPAVDRPRP